MRFISLITTFALGVSLALASDTVLRAAAPEPAPMLLTNAQRFQRGLPPNPPVARRYPAGVAAPARRSPGPPVPPVTEFGYIKVHDKDNKTDLGYLARNFNGDGEYGYTVSKTTDLNILSIFFSYLPEHPIPAFDITVENPVDSAFSFLGAIVGEDSTSADLAHGSTNYAYIGGVVQLGYGPPASNVDNSFSHSTLVDEDSEGAIWLFNPTTNAITAQWTNTDGTIVPVDFLYVTIQGGDTPYFAITGDAQLFKKTNGYGQSVTFTFVHS